ncbi:MAG: hypothetical protein P8Z40_09265, partial [Chloroflexota bacterium]
VLVWVYGEYQLRHLRFFPCVPRFRRAASRSPSVSRSAIFLRTPTPTPTPSPTPTEIPTETETPPA